MTSVASWLRAAALVTLAAGWLLACGDNVLFNNSGSTSGAGGATSASSSSSKSASSSNQSASSTNVVSSSSTGTMCGNGICEPPESSANCPQDCAPDCAHPICQVGGSLAAECDPCVQQVCAQDDFCCNNEWDDQCISQADQLCGTGCCGNGMCEGQNCSSCPDDCGECICGDMQCLGEDCSTCPADCGSCTPCSHTTCEVGPALSGATCPDPCVDMVCMQDASCCGQPFTPQCQQLAQMLCTGGSPCVNAVCAQHPQCCNNTWDQFCVTQTMMICQAGCNCAHEPCNEGPPLTATCDPCVSEICKADPYCCNANWDNICVGEVALICGISCGP